MIRYYLFLLLVIFLPFSIYAQQHSCATMPVLEQQLQQHPATQHRMDHLEQQVQKWIETHDVSKEIRSTYKIPVVVHIVWIDNEQNLPDSQIYSQMQVLNEDYNRLNPDTINTRSVFDSIASAVGIEFCMAKTDPNGNPTNGITRTEGNPTVLGFPVNFFDPFTNNIKSTSSGGVDPWPQDEYLNMWVGPLFTGLLGYAQFPQAYDSTQGPETDGVVITHSVFGRVGDLLSGYDDGRTTTHEVGHWLGLRHIWGDGDCTADDYVADTPLSDAASSGCDTTANNCVDSLFNYPDMVENFMDYSSDNCQNMFTLGQKARMVGFLLTDSMRHALTLSDKCSGDPLTVQDPLNQKLSLYPNPGSGDFTLDATRMPSKHYQLSIIDLTGRLIHEQTIQTPARVSFDLTQQSQGVYLLRLDNSQHHLVKRLILR